MGKASIYAYLKKNTDFTDYGIMGLMANIQAESNFVASNLQNTGNRKLGMTDAQYVAAVDSGKYSRDSFKGDSQGFGLIQWTWHSRKAKLFDFAKKKKKSIGDEEVQLDFMLSELKGYKAVMEVLRTAKSVKEASDAVMLQYERPADQSANARAKRASYGEALFKEFCSTFKTVSVKCQVLQKNAKGKPVRALQAILNARGFECGVADGDFGSKTDAAVRAFQKANGLEVDGSVGAKTWEALLN